MANNENKNLSDAANKMRTSDSAEERSKAASEMGKEGGKHSHGGHNSTDKGHETNKNLSDAANKMRTSDSAEERSKAASEMGREGGKHSHDRDKKTE